MEHFYPHTAAWSCLNSSVSNHEKLLLLAEWVNSSPPSSQSKSFEKVFCWAPFFLINSIDFLI